MSADDAGECYVVGYCDNSGLARSMVTVMVPASPFAPVGAPHGSDNPLIYGNFRGGTADRFFVHPPVTETEQLGMLIRRAWTAFARRIRSTTSAWWPARRPPCSKLVESLSISHYSARSVVFTRTCARGRTRAACPDR